MIIQARPTTYNGIEMRSRLEARYAAALDRMGLHWTYEPRAFASEDGQYLPDFLIRGDRLIYVEVKPVLDLGALRLALWRMEIIHSSDPDAFLRLYSDAEGMVFDQDPRTGEFWRIGFFSEEWKKALE